MEGKVIKFNLIGTILTIILIIALIAGVVVFAVKNNNKDNVQNNDNPNSEVNENIINNSSENNINIENDENKSTYSNNSKKRNVIDENKEYNEKIIVDGNEQDITMKICKGTFGYSIKYDANGFFVEKDKDGVDVFNSLYSNTIYMNISLEKGDFDELANDLLNQNGATEIEINGKRAIQHTQAQSNETIVTYYIYNSDEDYFIVSTHCGKGFENINDPIMNVMINSFEIISED